MNYKLIYSKLIYKALKRNGIEGYFELHHIVPKSLGGLDDKSNLIKLTAREHFIAHFLLAKIYGGNQWAAIARFKHGNKKSYFNSRLYEIARKKHAEQASKVHKGSKRSAEACVNISKSLIGKPQPWVSIRMKGNNFGSANKNRKYSAEQRANISAGMKRKRFDRECIALNALISSVFQ